MKKKSLMLLFCIPFAFALGGFAACEDDCDHTFADTLSSDSQYHWYAATCEHTDVKGDQEPHKDADNDGVCDVCGYDAGHIHTYDETWTSNQTKHWKAAKCTHSVKLEEADHVGVDDDGVCDVCGWSAEATHQHTFKDVYSTDATYHWHDAKCEHDVAVKEEHVDEDENNTCDVCGYVMYDLSGVISTATSSASAAKVSAVEFVYENPSDYYTYTNDYGYTYLYPYTYTYNYAFGNNYAKSELVKSVTYYQGYPVNNDVTTVAKKENVYYSMVSKGNIFALVENFGSDLDSADDDTLTRNKSAATSEMLGPKFSVGLLNENVYGVESALAAIYEKALESKLVFNYANGEEVEGAVTTYWIEFLYVGTSGLGYEYRIDFTLDDGVIDTFQMSVGQYDSDDLVANYDYATGEVEYLIKNNAEPSDYITYEVTQTIGDRTATAPTGYDKGEYLLTSFKLTDGTNVYEDGDSITIKTGDALTLSLTGDDVADKLAYAKIEYETDMAGYLFNNEWRLNSYANKTGGTYTVKAISDLAELTITVNIEWQELTSLDIYQAYVGDYGDDYMSVTGSQVAIYQGKEFKFKPEANLGANNAVTVAVSGTAADDTAITDADYTLDYDSTDYILVLSKVGTYTVTITSTVNDQITATVTVVVKEAPNVAELLSGTAKYESIYAGYQEVTITVVFTPESTGATNGTAVIAWSYWNAYANDDDHPDPYTANITVTYSYNETTGEVELTIPDTDDEPVEMYFDEEFNLYIEWYYQYPEAGWSYGWPQSGMLTAVTAVD